jgi:vacuolar-type H+-ATPase subunit D/Vma8
VNGPTGRSGRLRLVHRIEMARRGADLLERKQRVLTGELARLRLTTRRTSEEWQSAAEEAARWLRRSLELDGLERIAGAAAPEPATVRVGWQAAMGVVYPYRVVLVLPRARPAAASTALALAAAAHRSALEAAGRHAAAERALRLVEAELDATRLRQQAIERRLLPRLDAQLHRLETQLDELEREENVRLRWAAGARGTGRTG